jgi:D-Tyr-tRNAtyr deacylase
MMIVSHLPYVDSNRTRRPRFAVYAVPAAAGDLYPAFAAANRTFLKPGKDRGQRA